MAGSALTLIRPDWPAPARVRAASTTRAGGFSSGVYASLNLGTHVGDDPAAVKRNREWLGNALELPASPRWLNQVHGLDIVVAEGAGADPPRADGSETSSSGVVCAVLTADCLPVLLCDRSGQRVAAIHGGWRGLAAGILEAAVDGFARDGLPAGELLAWFGPAIGVAAYEVGEEVREAFASPGDRAAFHGNARGRYQLDLYALARSRLAAAGVHSVYGGDYCTHADPGRFFSYRRDGSCGRQATLIWLA